MMELRKKRDGLTFFSHLDEIVELHLDGDDEEGLAVLLRHGRVDPVGGGKREFRVAAGFLHVVGCGFVRDDIAEGSQVAILQAG